MALSGQADSDGKDADRWPKVRREGRKVVLVGGEHGCPGCPSDQDRVGVNDICRAGGAEQGTDRVSLRVGEGDDLAAAQEPAELGLSTRAADLGNDRGGGHGGDPELEPRPVVSPHSRWLKIFSDARPGLEEVIARAVVHHDHAGPSWLTGRPQVVARVLGGWDRAMWGGRSFRAGGRP